MDSIPKDCILEYPFDTFQDIRKLYNLDATEQMNKAIDILEEWVKTQNHFMDKNFSRAYLERTIISAKGSIERAKAKIDRNCTLRTLMPKFYVNYSTKHELEELVQRFQVVPLPKFAEDYNRVCMFKVYSDSKPSSLINVYRYLVIIWEYLKAYDYFNGVIFIADIRELDIMEYARAINLYELRQLSTLVMEGFGLRVKGIHLITSSAAVDIAVTLVKQVVSAKIGKRIMVHKTLESLQKHILKDVLPVEYGGSERSLENLQDEWIDVLSSKENVEYMKKVKKMVTNEDYRQSDSFNSQYLGMPGTFRTLHLD